MKILMSTDLHLNGDKDNFEYLKEFFRFADEKNPDLVLALGDIADTGFDGVDQQKFVQLSQGLMAQLAQHELARRSRHKDLKISPYEFFCTFPIIAEEVYFKKKYPGHIKEACREYLDLLDQVEWNLNNIYHIFNHIIGDNRQRTLTLPGNHDLNLERTVLKEMDLHKKSRIVKGLKVSGYGNSVRDDGSPVAVGCPAELTVPFNEYPRRKNVLDDIVDLYSEPRDFLDEERPDIAVLHNPIRGYLDWSMFMKQPIGNFGFLEYAKKGLTELFFSGHSHENPGIKVIKTENGNFSVVINPGPLGNSIYLDETGNTRPMKGGSFVEVDLDNGAKRFQSAKFYRISVLKNGENIVDTMGSVIRDEYDNLRELFTNQLAINVEYNQLKNKVVLK